MITEISICRCASCGDTPEVISPLLTCNYFFGFNGTGKSTIARLIANPGHPDFTDSTVSWTDDHALDVRVYNRDFIRENFDDADDLKGVFTLGKDTKEVKTAIAAKKVDAERLISEVGSLRDELTQATTDLAQLDSNTANACWNAVEPRDSIFREVFAGGFLRSQDAFMRELLRNRGSSAELHERTLLEERARVVLDASPEPRKLLPGLETTVLRHCADEQLLKTRIVGSGDVPIARLIEKMGNSDWVRHGQRFLDESEGRCPFCQEPLPVDLQRQLNAFFDEEFLRLMAAYERYVRDYHEAAQGLLDVCERILEGNSEHLNFEAFQAKTNAIRSEVGVNAERLAAKTKEPSRVVDLVSLTGLLDDAESLVASANARIEAHNRTVANIEEQRQLLAAQVWKYLADGELKPQLDTYAASQRAKSEHAQKLRSNIEEKSQELARIENEIQLLEGQVTDVRQVLNDINGRLKSFGFRGFSLKATPDGKSYMVVRSDGSPARENLSEGERSFVTFLYFYHLIDGSHDSSGTTTDKIVVFDDPVSSMDSEVLFIVSSLIRLVCDRASRGKSHVKQVFVFTHNVYFHKEISYNRKRLAKDAYWVVRKPATETQVEGHANVNPIKTSYQLLWDEVGRDDPSPASVQNNIRRILEYYFQFLGDTKLRDLPAQFNDDDPDKATCMALVSWVNDGSHSIDDDIVYSSIDPSTVAKYLVAFRRIFEETNQMGHYLMMCSDKMRAEYEEEQVSESFNGSQEAPIGI